MSVVKPWMFGSPDPETSHSLAGLPGFEFSQAISLTIGGSHGAAAALPTPGPISRNAMTATQHSTPRRAAPYGERSAWSLIRGALRESRHRPSYAHGRPDLTKFSAFSDLHGGQVRESDGRPGGGQVPNGTDRLRLRVVTPQLAAKLTIHEPQPKSSLAGGTLISFPARRFPRRAGLIDSSDRPQPSLLRRETRTRRLLGAADVLAAGLALALVLNVLGQDRPTLLILAGAPF